MKEFDTVDRAILAALRNDARISNKALADKAGIAPSTCLARVARLEQDGVLIGYHAELEPRAVGIGVQAMISVRLAKHDRREVEAFVQHLLSLREVLMVFHVAGVNDYSGACARCATPTTCAAWCSTRSPRDPRSATSRPT